MLLITGLKTLLLAGNLWPVILPQIGFLVFFMILFVGLALKTIRKKVE